MKIIWCVICAFLIVCVNTSFSKGETDNFNRTFSFSLEPTFGFSWLDKNLFKGNPLELRDILNRKLRWLTPPTAIRGIFYPYKSFYKGLNLFGVYYLNKNIGIKLGIGINNTHFSWGYLSEYDGDAKEVFVMLKLPVKLVYRFKGLILGSGISANLTLDHRSYSYIYAGNLERVSISKKREEYFNPITLTMIIEIGYAIKPFKKIPLGFVPKTYFEFYIIDHLKNKYIENPLRFYNLFWGVEMVVMRPKKG